MLVVAVRRSWRRLEPIEDLVSADICRVVQVSEPDLVARGEAVNLFNWPSELARSAKPPNPKISPGKKVSPWTVLLTIEDAIKPRSDDIEELSVKASMSVSKLADLG